MATEASRDLIHLIDSSKLGLFQYYSNRRHSPAALGAFIDCLLDRDLPASKRRSKAAA